MIYHLIGIGGIGMSAIARILLQKGERVQGSDASDSVLIGELRKEGANIAIGHREVNVSEGMTVIYSTDIKETNVEWKKAKALRLPIFHRSEMLDRLMREKKPLLITGTHGKTTTTALLAEVLCEANWDPSFVVGGILRSKNRNAHSGKGAFFVAEADESDGSFLKTPAYGAIVTNLENEHLNYWGSEEKLDEGFVQFFQQVRNQDHLFWCCDDQRLSQIKPPGISYGFSESAGWRVSNVSQNEKGIRFDLFSKGKYFYEIELSLFGRHNALNGAAVFGLASSLQIPEEAIRKAFQNFAGIKRRLECKGEAAGVMVFDDYGHHPTEIAVTLKALKDRIGKKRLCAVFQPHRFSRVRDLLKEFVDPFLAADLVILTDIYSAGESPIEGISTEVLYKEMEKKIGGKLHYIPRKQLEQGAARLAQPNDVFLTIGAGDVTRAGDAILALLRGSQ